MYKKKNAAFSCKLLHVFWGKQGTVDVLVQKCYTRYFEGRFVHLMIFGKGTG